MSEGQDALIGRVLGGTYQVERKLGEGGMGAVFAARNVRTGKSYAVKVLLPELSQRKESLARFEREARALAALGHEGIVAIHDFATEADGLAFLVMERLEGEELGERIKREGRLAPEHAVQLAMQIASALAAAHSLGLVHRDLKPSNVFLTRRSGGEERAVLLDFGLARSVHGGDEEGLGKLTASGVVMGTPHYMSPEQAQGRAVDARSDLYALGAMLFEMLSGRPPFEGPTLAMLFALLVTTDAPTLASLGVPVQPALDALVHACLEKEPSRRPASAVVLGELLAAFPHRPALAVSPSPSAFPRTLASRDFAESPTVDGIRIAPAPQTRQSAPVPTPLRRSLVPFAVAGVVTLALAAALGGAWALFQSSPRSAVPPITTSPALALSDAGAVHEAPAEPVSPAAPALAIDGGQETPLAPRAPRVHGARGSRAAPDPTPPALPPGMTPPPGFDRIQAAAARIEQGDFAGCLRELRTAPETAQVLGMRMSCAQSAGDRAALTATCARLHQRFPTHPYVRACDSLLGP